MDKRELTGKELRHKRRVKSQAIVYTTSACLLLILLIGIVFGTRWVIKSVKEYNQKVEAALNEAEEQLAMEQESVVAQETPKEEISEPEVPTTDPLDELVDALIADMTMEEKVAGLFILTPEALTNVNLAIQAKDGTKKAIEENPIGGLIYSDKNYKSADQFMQMISNTRGYSKYPLFIVVQKEIGKTKTFGIDQTASASELTSTDAVSEAYAAITERLIGMGINMNLAPVADVVSEEGNQSLQGRTFSSDATSAAPLVNAAVSSMQSRGLSAALRTFPGEGSLDKSGQITKSLEELNNSDFIAYQMAINNGVDCVMISNAKAPALTDDDMPCVFSRKVVNEYLRNQLGFNGVVITSMLNEKAITDRVSSKDAAVLSVMAGADMLLCPADYQAAYKGIMEAIETGMITPERIDQSLHRIYRIKYKNVDLSS